MNLSPLLRELRTLPGYREFTASLQSSRATACALPIMRSARTTLAAALAQDLEPPIVVISPRVDRLLTYTEELTAWSPELELYTFPDPNPLFYERSPWGPRSLQERARTLAYLTSVRHPQFKTSDRRRPSLILAAAKGLITRTLAPKTFDEHTQALTTGDRAGLQALARLLTGAGYDHQSVVTQPGEFSRRGGILDIWPPIGRHPVRIEFFGDEIESIRTFDPQSQRSIQRIENTLITPAREGLPSLLDPSWEALTPDGAEEGPAERSATLEYFLPWMSPEPQGLLDFLPEGALVLLDSRTAIEEAIDEQERHALEARKELEASRRIGAEFPLPYLTMADVEEALGERTAVDLSPLGSDDDTIDDLNRAFTAPPRFGGQLTPLLNFIADRRREHASVIVVSRQAARIAELWSEGETEAPVLQSIPEPLEAGDLHFVVGALSEGWSVTSAGETTTYLLTDAEIFGWIRPRRRAAPRKTAAAPESSYADLKAGSWVVHVDFGIGLFRGLVERTIDEIQREYLLVEYAEGDQVYVPIHQADRLTPYVGMDGASPSASRLGTREWERAKSHAKQAVEEVARDLLDLYARRMAAQGHAFSPDTDWQRELEASFPYGETPDQLQAIQVIKEDMEKPRPMDRLICGDAGYGKTEVALRASFKAVMDGKQVAVLVPTTVLAQQHLDTFRQRLAAFPIEVEMLSRFRTRSEIETLLGGLGTGEVDIVIGTHRLLQKDVTFKDLGLLIIDEEQRFGVTHKEHLKRMRTEVDVLTLTATPIPRTLYMALTGARDISTINTPPEERLPVSTFVGKYDPKLVRQAILRELDRGGQVFFVHNRVKTIGGVEARLKRLLPEVRFGVAHGQMPEKDLASVMQRFSAGEVDVLVSTSIIESGLDIPNANTLIVDQADMFGLGQLYQLRGRVGRAAVRGYAYFFRSTRSRATEEGLERLEILSEHTELGAGYSIALRDLEMRGAGEILGTRQHGQIAAVGFHLYTQLLASAVRRMKADRVETAPSLGALPSIVDHLPVSIDLPLQTIIPPDYVPDRELRLQIYRRMAEMRSRSEIEALENELIDRFGPMPEEVRNLLYQLHVKVLAADADILAVVPKNGQIQLQLPDKLARRTLEGLGQDVRRSKAGLWLARGEGRQWMSRLLELLQLLKTENQQ